MRAVDIIARKRDGLILDQSEIDYFVAGIADGSIPDYQVTAWAMAVLLNGMTPEETTHLTLAMANSGERIDLTGVVPFAVDKHSTGGVGDKTTLVVEPTVAACGVPVGKMSGRGLGFSGGTLDKMESIAGYRVDLTTEAFLEQLKRIGVVLCGQTANLAPADGRLYALRDVSGTVPSIPLIASSVMSKKLAGGAEGIVLDVKVGRGAFMPDVPQAKQLAGLMVEIGQRSGRWMTAIISDMNQPLGFAVGNALEVKEALATLQGGGPPDFREHCLTVAGHMLLLAGQAEDLPAARTLAAQAIDNGASLAKFRQLVEAQGGDLGMVDHPDRLPAAPHLETIPAAKNGYLERADALEIAMTAVALGAGRSKKGDPIDHRVGLVLHHKVGDQIIAGEPLLTIHAANAAAAAQAAARLAGALAVSEAPVEPLTHHYAVLTGEPPQGKARPGAARHGWA
jgi:pyrimidine-nucleoside phosphorylase